MLVYRIEDQNGFGAFHALDRFHDYHAFEEGLRTAMDHPAACSDEERGTELAQYSDPRTRIGFRFGCRSKPQLRMWFRSKTGREAMAAAGGVMVTYWVPDDLVKRGRYQVIFPIDKATKVSAVPANDW